LGAVLLIVTCIGSHASGERVLSQYDEDSLVYLSTAVVRAQVGAPHRFDTADGSCTVYDVKVLDSYKGPLQPSSSARVTGLDFFHHAPGIKGAAPSWNPIGTGDVVYLFLAPNNGKSGYAMYRLTNADWVVIESGVRLLFADQVYSFFQYSLLWPPPEKPRPDQPVYGGFVAMTPTVRPGSLVLSRQDFERRLTQSNGVIEKISVLLAAPPSVQSGHAIEAFLNERKQVLAEGGFRDDALSWKIASRLQDTHTPPEELIALLHNSPGYTPLSVGYILQTANYRDYVLKCVEDQQALMDRRMELASIVADSGWTYIVELEGRAGPANPNVKPDYAMRIAKAAANNLGSQLGEKLLDGVVSCAISPEDASAARRADLHSAAGILSDSFEKAATPERYLLAKALIQIDRGVYAKTLPRAGALLTYVEPAGNSAQTFAGRDMHLECQFVSQLSVVTQLKLVLQQPQSKAEVILPVDTKVGEMTNTFGYNWEVTAHLPEKVAGKYYVFLRDYLDDKPNGDGLGVEMTIP
jgi:hypothetical protein